MALPFRAVGAIVCPVNLISILMLISVSSVPCAIGADAKSNYEKLAIELKVRELNTLMFAKYNDANLAKLAAFLKKHPKAPEREKALYLRAYMTWSLHRYEKAPALYAALLKEFPKSKFTRIARIREAAAYLFSGQAAKALPRLRALKKDYPGRPEIYARELAYSLSRCGQQKEALAFMDRVELQMEFAGKKRLLSRISSHFDKIRLIGKPLQKFRVKDFKTGKVISPATLKGKVVLIDFWATWCGPCIAELPNVKRAYEKLHPKGFEIIGISLDSKESALRRFVKKEKMPWPQYFDGKGWKNSISTAHGIRSIPAMWLVDKQGNLVDLSARAGLEGKVEALLASPTPEAK